MFLKVTEYRDSLPFSPRNRISLSAKFALSSTWIFRDSTRTHNGGSRRVGSQYQWMVSQGADVANHHCDNGWPSCHLQRVAEDRVPTCTCYLYAVKFISRLGHRPPWFYLQLYTCPCLYAPNTQGRPERQNEWEREDERGGWERDGGQIEHEPVPHLLPRVSRS